MRLSHINQWINTNNTNSLSPKHICMTGYAREQYFVVHSMDISSTVTTHDIWATPSEYVPFDHLLTAKAQIRCEAWSWLSLSVNRIIDGTNGGKGPVETAHVHDDLNQRILRMFRGTVSLYMALCIYAKYTVSVCHLFDISVLVTW